MPDGSARSTLPLTGWLSIGGGILVAALFLYLAFGSRPPPLPLTFGVLFAGALAVALGVGLLRRRRVAWSFALALYIVAAIVFVLGGPAIARSGVHPVLAALPALVTISMVVLLSLSQPDQ